MKKLIMLAVVLMVSAVTFGQVRGYRPVMILPDTSTKFPTVVKAGDLVYVSSTKTMYEVEVGVGISKNMNYVLSSASNYTQPNTATLGGYDPTYYVDTATNQNIRGVKTFFDAPRFAIGTSATGNGNIGIGYGAMGSVTTAVQSVGIGNYALRDQTTNGTNVAIGYGACESVTGAVNDVGIGHEALINTTGAYNTGVGAGVLTINTTGTYNSALGYHAGYGNKTGANNIYVGKNAGPRGSTSDLSDRLYISNIVGGQDTAIIYGVMGATPAASTLQLNAAVSTPQLPTFTIAGGTATIGVKDTVGLAVAGLTTNAIVVASYNAESTASKLKPDTAAAVYTVRAGWLTLGGKYGWKVNYFIPKK